MKEISVFLIVFILMGIITATNITAQCSDDNPNVSYKELSQKQQSQLLAFVNAVDEARKEFAKAEEKTNKSKRLSQVAKRKRLKSLKRVGRALKAGMASIATYFLTEWLDRVLFEVKKQESTDFGKLDNLILGQSAARKKARNGDLVFVHKRIYYDDAWVFKVKGKACYYIYHP